MSLQSLLDQLLKSAGVSGAARPDLGKYATGALAGGALAMLLGSRRGRSVGGKVIKIGTVAALGALAWRTYQEHQSRQGAAPGAQEHPLRQQGATGTLMAPSFEALPAPQQEQHAKAMLKAMLVAARADGHMDDRERGLVEAELHRLEAEPELRAWVDTELRRPVEPAEVAAMASSPEMASEIYLASVLVVDQRSTMERAYLDALAQALKLPPALKVDLESRLGPG